MRADRSELVPSQSVPTKAGEIDLKNPVRDSPRAAGTGVKLRQLST